MRCPDCNKFVGNDEQDPDDVSVDVDEHGVVTVTARIVNACAECGTDLTEATLEMECDRSDEVAAHRREKHPTGDPPDLSADEERAERSSRTVGKGRGLRTFYGADVDYTVECECGWVIDGTASDDVQASSMESLV